ncbi:MAG: SEC-C metal-binding domain-containing protein [Capsulimonadales bacterium]|nr:SEC-C metal-binding domain-containing protein [Capsulimonadales bacterium]
MLQLLKKLFDGNERDVNRYRKVVDKVNALEAQFQELTDEQLRAKTDEFRERFKKNLESRGNEEALESQEREAVRGTREANALRVAINESLDEILPEAFAACREAGRRTLGMRHFDVQLIGGMVQHDGRIAELKTGEGKTLMCTLATYLNAIAGRGVHVVTANDYLVKRDAVWMGPLFHLLGMTVGILQGHSPETGEGGGTFIYDPEYEDPSVDGLDARYKFARPLFDRKDAYLCDITYGTSSEFGFDYLRDNMSPSLERMVQARGHHYAIVDECDSNLIDEARTPLIISGPAEKPSDLYYLFDRLIPRLEKGEAKKDKYDTETDEKDFTVDEKAKTATYTERGFDKIESALRTAGYPPAQEPDYDISSDREAMQYATSALKAHAVFVKDKDYVVKTNNEGKPEVVIVDENTGRLMFGRRWSDGLHQAVEAKEGIKIEQETQTLANITIQNYFRLYRKLAGMTGTAKTEEDEFRKIYALDVVQVPTNKPMARRDLADVIYKSEEAKLRGIAMEILQVYCRRQPTLVGTRSIEMSERVSSRLTFQALEVLGAVILLRNKLEADRKSLGDKYKSMSDLINRPITELTIPRLEGIARELGVSIKMLDETVLENLGTALGIPALDPPVIANLAKVLEKPEGEVKTEFADAQRARLRDALTYGIEHNVLNAKYHEQEARIIAEAGRKGAITIATNMAGRGVDIILGGTHYKETSEDALQKADFSYRRGGAGRPASKRGPMAIAHVVGKSDQAADPETLGPAGAGTISLTEEEETADFAREREEVRALGGLYILGTERHESRRIDNQLRGRSGRQGDPGYSRFHVSLEDYLWRVFGDRSNSLMMRAWEEDQAVDMPMLSPMIERAQKKVEQFNFDSRKHVLEYDDVMNVQRARFYADRRTILEGADLRETFITYLHEAVDTAIEHYCSDNLPAEEWDRAGLFENVNQLFPLANYVRPEELEPLNRPQIEEKLHDAADQAYTAKEEEFGMGEDGETPVMRDVERYITLQEMDQAWKHHLADMDYLREGIGLRGYAQVDPLVAYKKEALELFEQMQASIRSTVVRNIFLAQVQFQQPDEANLFEIMQRLGSGDLEGVDLSQLPPELLAEMQAQAQTQQAPQPIGPTPEVEQLVSATAASQRNNVPKVGPNDPCPCGSGKKYKNCHRNKK